MRRPRQLTRRKLLRTGLTTGLLTTLPPVMAGEPVASAPLLTFPGQLPEFHHLPAQIPQPVILAAVELFEYHKTLFLRTRSTDGVEGIVKCNGRLQHHPTLFKNLVVPFFLGKDLRGLETLLANVPNYRRGYKFAGLPYWNSVGHLELSALDLLGKTANKSVGALLGKVIHRQLPFYLSSTRRDTTPAQEVAWLGKRVAETGAGAIKIKVGGRMSRNADAAPGRSQGLVALARKTFGERMVIYADANGSYDAPTAIRVGHMLQDHGVSFFEEPCPWQDFEMTRQVADALQMDVAGGEQDSSLPKWRWMIEHRALDIVQPDLLYNGGLIRCLAVARMAARAGLKVIPHAPRNDSEVSYTLHFASIVPNIGAHQEFQAAPPKDRYGYHPEFKIVDGVIPVPTTPGLGVVFDKEIWQKGKRLLYEKA
ncbi:mandelate racemase/muconate lactonizing enzyme family protein [Exilibacterium tricleocarpae]|uniref:Mandelate racemase/muconate lactonizing enzyme family protein n=1 Tax=Exilibacterium tricleocarpae TaxID=2591008 RepID=A0A545U826_9GAMM|nr:mandelate racemase/muconate lactonizing enzyme family protein [Exilibacterium tricleocarpae]TQV85625.1 mandelate racemase/muconate lactonizing enzyme family protein [Exilibacterium tricleocarpae]